MAFRGVGSAVWGELGRDGALPQSLLWGPPPASAEAFFERAGVSHAGGEGVGHEAFCQGLQGLRRHDLLPELAHEDGQPPQVPNIYTDGSVVPSAWPERAAAGVG
eukprot:11891258-Alexandrium_andersonii.AAC.1